MLISRRDIAIRSTDPQCAEGNFGALPVSGGERGAASRNNSEFPPLGAVALMAWWCALRL
jgi:hypothetical protein